MITLQSYIIRRHWLWMTLILVLYSGFGMRVYAQLPEGVVMAFDFDKNNFGESHNRSRVSHLSVSLTADRFGNSNQAILTNGDHGSYFNLGTNEKLKSQTGTISLWVNLSHRVYLGRGADTNPILTTRSSSGWDSCNALCVYYDPLIDKICFSSMLNKDSAAVIFSKDQFMFNNWHHIAVTFSDNAIELYLDGKLQEKSPKFFKTKYLASDSLLIAHSGNPINQRYAQGVFDDIYFYNRVLSSNEITALYEMPDPKHSRNLLFRWIKLISIFLAAGLIVLLVVSRSQKKHRIVKEILGVKNQLLELEIKAIKSQMNPHFMSNCLAAIQQLIYTEQADKASQYIARFNYFLRLVLEYSSKTFIPLEKELEMIKLNVELEQLRFDNRFEFDLQTDPSLNQLFVPSIITQPFVENAIWHGLLRLNGIRKPKLQIIVHRTKDALFIHIKDNGVGRTPESQVSNHESKGLRLITEKLNLLNQKKNTSAFGFNTQDQKTPEGEPSGTHVTICLPVITEPND